MSRDERFEAIAKEIECAFDGDIKIGGQYEPWLRDGTTIYVSGQIPRVGDTVKVCGRVGAEASLTQAQFAASISAMRALAWLQRALGSLDQVDQLLRLGVYMQCTQDFTQQSEVADGASQILTRVLGEAGRHTRTSVGVFNLPKNAAVELDLVARTKTSG